jgi:hypothetical protein
MKRRQEDKVKEAWWLLYKQQKESNPWPPILGEKFLSLKDILDDPAKDVPRNFREIYRNEIEKALPKLLEIVDFRHYEPATPEEAAAAAPGAAAPGPASGLVGGEMAGPLGQQMKPVGTVDWNATDKARIEGEFNFGDRVPTSCEVRLTQENYWVYKALLNIIRKTNGDATTHAGAAVKEILALEIGKTAAGALGTRPGFLATAAGGAGGSAVPMAEGGPSAAGGSMGGEIAGPGPTGAGGDTTAATGDAALLANRYVDDKMKPLASPDPAYPEFNMMPVHLVLVIDQRRIPDLLVQCANSTMPVEVVEMRISRGKIEAGTPGMGGMPGGMGGLPHGGPANIGGMGGMPMGMGGAMGAGGVGGAGEIAGPTGPGMVGGVGGAGQLGAEDEEASPYDVNIEIFGIIYIYNPPKDTARQVPGGTTDAAAGVGALAAPTGGTTPVAPATPAAP